MQTVSVLTMASPALFSSMLLYVHWDHKDGDPRTATSTLTQLLSCDWHCSASRVDFSAGFTRIPQRGQQDPRTAIVHRTYWPWGSKCHRPSGGKLLSGLFTQHWPRRKAAEPANSSAVPSQREGDSNSGGCRHPKGSGSSHRDTPVPGPADRPPDSPQRHVIIDRKNWLGT